MITVFKTLWGNNGDILSLQYGGFLSDMKDETLIERTESIERYNMVCKIFTENKYQENFKNHILKLLLENDSRSNIKRIIFS